MNSADQKWSWSLSKDSLTLAGGSASTTFRITEGGGLANVLPKRISTLETQAAEQVYIRFKFQKCVTPATFEAQGSISIESGVWSVQSTAFSEQTTAMSDVFNQIFSPNTVGHQLDTSVLAFPPDLDLPKLTPQDIAHFFGDSFIKDMQFDGTNLEGSDVRSIVGIVSHFIKHLQTQRPTQFSSEVLQGMLVDIKNLLAVQDDLDEAISAYRQCVNTGAAGSLHQTMERSPEALKKQLLEIKTSFAKKMSTRLANLPVNHSLLIPGGWDENPFGHLVYYHVTRVAKDAYDFRAYNRGEGSEVQNSLEEYEWEDEQLKSRKRTSGMLRAPAVTEARMTAEDVWIYYFEMKINEPITVFGEVDLIKTAYRSRDLINFLKSIDPDISTNALPQDEELSTFVKDDDAGTCTWKDFVPLLQHRLKHKAIWRSFKHELHLYLSVNLFYQVHASNTTVAETLHLHRQGTNWKYSGDQRMSDWVTLIDFSMMKFETSIAKDLKSDFIQPKQAIEAEHAINAVREQVQVMHRTLRITTKLPTFNLSQLETAVMPIPVIPERKPPMQDDEFNPDEQSFVVLALTTDWDKNCHSAVAALESYVKAAEEDIEANNVEVYHFIDAIFDSLPVDSNPSAFWKDLSVKENESAMDSLSKLGSFYLRTALEIGQFTEHGTVEQIARSLKVLRVMHQFYKRLLTHPNYSGLDFDQQLDFIPANKAAGHPKNPYFLILDPKLDREWEKTISYFHLFEYEPHFLVARHPFKEEDGDRFSNDQCQKEKYIECSVVYRFITQHQNVADQITAAIKDAGEEISAARMVAYALHNDRPYLPVGYRALKTQYYIAQAFSMSRRDDSCDQGAAGAFTYTHIDRESIHNVKVELAGVEEVHINTDENTGSGDYIESFDETLPHHAFDWSLKTTLHEIYGLYNGNKASTTHNLQNVAIVQKHDDQDLSLERRRQLENILNPANKHFQAFRAFLFAESNWSELGSSDFRVLLSTLVLEPRVLRLSIDHVRNIDQVFQRFHVLQFDRFVKKKDVTAAVFVFMLGCICDRYILDAKSQGRRDLELLSFPDPTSSIDRLRQLEALTPNDKRLICHAQLFALGQRPKVQLKDLDDVLYALFIIKETSNTFDEPLLDTHFCVNTDRLNLPCLEVLQRLADDKEYFQKTLPEVCNKLLIRLIPHAHATSWVVDKFPIVTSSNLEYKFDFFELHLNINNMMIGEIPTKISNHKLFKRLFDSELLTQVQGNKHQCTFVDTNGFRNEINAKDGSEAALSITRDINGIKYIHRKDQGDRERYGTPHILDQSYQWHTTCLPWECQEGQREIVYIENKTGVIYGRFDTRKQRIINQVPGSACHELLLVDKSNTQNNFALFGFIDRFWQAWSDDFGTVKAVELPTYRHTFLKRKGEDGRERFWSSQFAEYFVSDNQDIGLFQGHFRHYLVLENDDKGKLVLMPNGIIDQSSGRNISGNVEFNLERLTSKECHIFTYSLEPSLEANVYKEKLQSSTLHSNLFLGFLFTMMHRWAEAHACFALLQSSHQPVQKIELGVIKRFLSFSMSHINAITELLYLMCVLIEHQAKFQKNLEKLSINNKPFSSWVTDALLLYVQKSPYSSTNRLTKDQELTLLNYLTEFAAETTPYFLTQRQTLLENKDLVRSHRKKNVDGLPSYPKQHSFDDAIEAERKNESEKPFSLSRDVPTNFWQETFGEFSRVVSTQKPTDLEPFRRWLRLNTEKYGIRKLGQIGMNLMQDFIDGNRDDFEAAKADAKEWLYNCGSDPCTALASATRSTKFCAVIPPKNTPQSQVIVQRAIPWTPPPPLPALLTDQQVEDFFEQTSLSSHDFHKVKEQIGVLESAIKTCNELVVRKSLEKFKSEIEAYVVKPNGKHLVIKRDALDSLEGRLFFQHQTIKLKMGAIRTKMVALNNYKPSDMRLAVAARAKVKPPELADLFQLFLAGESQAYFAVNPHWSLDQIGELRQLTGEFLVFADREKHLFRACALIRKIKSNTLPARMLDLSRKLLDVLTARSFVDPQKHPLQLLYQYSFNRLLREDQVLTLDKFYKAKHFILQREMGYGKSMLRFVAALELADGSNLVMVMVSQDILKATIDDMRREAWSFMPESLVFLNWSDVSQQNLRALQDSLIGIINKRQCTIVTDKQLRLFKLQARYAEYQLAHLNQPTEQDLEDAKLRVVLFRECLQLISTKGIILGDEVDLLHDIRDEVNLSFGELKKSDSQLCDLVAFLYEVMFTDEEITSKVHCECGHRFKRKDTSLLFTRALFENISLLFASRVIKCLEKRATDSPKSIFATLFFSLISHPTHFSTWILHYLVDDQQTLSKHPDYLANVDPDIRHAWGDVRAIIRTMSQTLSENYKDSHGLAKASSVAATPHRKGKPKPTSEFGHDIASQCYTLQAHLFMGISPQFLTQHIENLQNQSHRNMGAAENNFRALLAGIHNFTLLGITQKQTLQLANEINQDRRRLINFIGSQILPQHTRPTKRMASRSHEITRMSARSIGFSGTLNEHDQYYPEEWNIEREEGLSGQVAAQFAEMPDNFSVIEASDPLGYLKELDDRGKLAQAHVFIDLAGVFKSYSKDEVVKLFFERPGMQRHKGIVHSEDHTHVIPKEPKTAKVSVNNMDPASRFSFYTAQHGFAIHIDHDPNALAIVTGNANLTLRDYKQAFTRMRLFGKGQRVHVVFQKDSAQTLASQFHLASVKDVSGHHVLPFAKIFEETRGMQDVVLSLKYKLDDLLDEALEAILKRVVIDIDNDSNPLNDPLYQDLIAFGIHLDETRDENYGKVAQLLDAKDVFMQYKTTLLTKVSTFLGKYRGGMASIDVQTLENLGSQMNALINKHLEGKDRVIPDKLSNVMQSVDTAVETEQTTETTTTMQQQSRTELQEHHIDKLFKAKPAIYKYPVLESLQGLFTKDFYKPITLKADYPALRDDNGQVWLSYKRNSFTYVTAQQSVSDHISNLQKPETPLLNLFSPNLLISEPYLRTVEPMQGPFDYFQKPIDMVLVRQEVDTGNWSVIILSEPEVQQISSFMMMDQKQPVVGKRELQVALYHPDKYSALHPFHDAGVVMEGHSRNSLFNFDHPQLRMLMVQTRFFAGKTSYTPEEQKLLFEWLGSNPHIQQIESYFREHILQWKKEESDHYPESTLFLHVFTPLIEQQTKTASSSTRKRKEPSPKSP